MIIYKLKFDTHEQAKQLLESVQDYWLCEPVQIAHHSNALYDIILSEERAELEPYRVTPTQPKHLFSGETI